MCLCGGSLCKEKRFHALLSSRGLQLAAWLWEHAGSSQSTADGKTLLACNLLYSLLQNQVRTRLVGALDSVNYSLLLLKAVASTQCWTRCTVLAD